MKHVQTRLYADPEATARQLVQLAASIEPVQDGHIHIEKINAPFLYTLKGSASDSAPASSMLLSKAGSSCTRAGPMCGC